MRDKEIMRSLLRQIRDRRNLDAEGVDRDALFDHLRLLIDEGLVKGVMLSADRTDISLNDPTLTSRGHDFLKVKEAHA